MRNNRHRKKKTVGCTSLLSLPIQCQDQKLGAVSIIKMRDNDEHSQNATRA